MAAAAGSGDKPALLKAAMDSSSYARDVWLTSVAAGEHKTWKCVFPCKNCGGTEAGPRRDRGGTVEKYPFSL